MDRKLFNTETQRHRDFLFFNGNGEKSKGEDSVTLHKNRKTVDSREAELLSPTSTVAFRPTDTKKTNYKFSVSLCLCVKSFWVAALK